MPEAAGAASVTATTEAYYDSDEADSFYAEIWGGEDIHIGVYQRPDEDVATASSRTVETVAGHVDFLKPEHRVLNLGAGYGGAGRYLATKFGCQVDCLNLSDVQNERNRVLTSNAGLSDLVHASVRRAGSSASPRRVLRGTEARRHPGPRPAQLRLDPG